MEAIVVKKNPNCTDMLRTMSIGEEKTFKLLGTIYNTMLTARTRLRKEGCDYLFTVDAQNNTMTISRVK